MPASVTPLLSVVMHTAAIYTFLIGMLRFANRRQLGQLTVIDLVIIILLGSAVETAMVNGNTSLQAGITCSSTLLVLNRTVSRLLRRSKHLRHLVLSGPVLLVHNGRSIQEHLRRAGMTDADLMEALREREQTEVADVRFAVLEVDGSINVVPMRENIRRSHRTESKTHMAGGA